jgi:hypothetical protein
MAKKKRRVVIDQLDEISPYEFEMPLGDLLKKVKDYLDTHGPEAYIEWDSYYHAPYDHDPSPRYFVRRNREEDDQEYEKRIKEERVREALTEERDRAEFERLQKKFKK